MTVKYSPRRPESGVLAAHPIRCRPTGILHPVGGRVSRGMECRMPYSRPTTRPVRCGVAASILTGRRLPPGVSESGGRRFANLGIELVSTCGMASGDESMQDHDRSRAVDQGRDAGGVFAGEQRPGGPCCSVGQDKPVGGEGDAVEPLGAHCPDNLRQADHAGETGPEPSEQLRNHRVTSSRARM